MKNLPFAAFEGYQKLIEEIRDKKTKGSIGLIRSLRIPFALQLQSEIQIATMTL